MVMLGLGRLSGQTDQPPSARDEKKRRVPVRRAPHRSFLRGSAWERVRPLIRREVHAAWGSAWELARRLVRGSACGLARVGCMRRVVACACAVTTEREECGAHILLGIELRIFHTFRCIFHLDVICVSFGCCMCFIWMLHCLMAIHVC
jgi:hypothetical protein